MPLITTPRLRLVPVTLEAIEAVLDHDKPRAEAAVGAQFPDAWPNDDLVALGFPYSRDALRASPGTRLWGDSLVLLKDEPRVVGSVVFHGHPADGVAEVAYSIEESSRCRGFAAEAVTACVEWALTQSGGTDAMTPAMRAAFMKSAARLGIRVPESSQK